MLREKSVSYILKMYLEYKKVVMHNGCVQIIIYTMWLDDYY